MTARRVPTVTAAIQVLRHIKDNAEALGVTHVSRASCLSKSTVPGIIGDVRLLILIVGFPLELPRKVMHRHGQALRRVAESVTSALGGFGPAQGPTIAGRDALYFPQRAAR